jgi:glycosyltransferase involved in cell wall biosynthesis
MKRLAFVVSHPIQYYAPLHQRLARRADIQIKVFFTWHAGGAAVLDHGFKRPIAWDVNLDGYDYELVGNVSAQPGTHRFFGLRNPGLVRAVQEWKPDAVHVTGWAWWSHLHAIRALSRAGIPVLFRGDSHLLDSNVPAVKRLLKRIVLGRIFLWPAAFPYVGAANRAYYKAFGVPDTKLFHCPHSIDVGRFAGPDEYEARALQWRRDLGIADSQVVILFAGKFEPKKQPLELASAVIGMRRNDIVLVMVGGGVLEDLVQAMAKRHPATVKVLPVQNQSNMPVIYRVGDLCVLPSSHGETWGLAVNEALASGRPVLMSDRVGASLDVADDGCAWTFRAKDQSSLKDMLVRLTGDRERLREARPRAREKAWGYDITRTESSLLECLARVC